MTATTGSAVLAGVAEYAGVALGVTADEVGEWAVEPVAYEFASPTTAGLYRIRGEGWSLFLKVLQSYRRWPLFHVLPLEWLQDLPVDEAWRYEADIYSDGLARALPEGLRLCDVYGMTDLGDDRLVLAIEDVNPSPVAWDRRRFGRAAELLGRLNARLTRDDALPTVALRKPGQATNLYYVGRVIPAAFPALADDGLWSHPLLAELADPHLRADLFELAGRPPATIEHLARLPQLLSHGDASPQNLLVPADDPDTFVVIDWTMSGLTAAGDDLSQLLVGLAHDGELAVAELAAMRDVLVRQFTAGLAAEGFMIDEGQVRDGMDGGLTVRSAFTALPFERLGEPVIAELVELFRHRLALTRYLVDLGLALPVS